MDDTQLHHHWTAIKGKLKQRYGQLTDNDLEFAEGKGEELMARLQEKLSIPREELETTLDELTHKAGGKMREAKAIAADVSHEIRAKAGALADELKEKATAMKEDAKAQGIAAYDEARQRARGLWEEGEEYVRQNPRESMIAALAAGFVAGIVMLRR